MMCLRQAMSGVCDLVVELFGYGVRLRISWRCSVATPLWIVEELAPVPSRSIITGVMCVPAFRSLEAIIHTGIVIPGNELATCLTSCVSIITSRHKRPGTRFNTVYCSSSERCGRRVGVVAGGEALSLARATPAAFPAFGVVTVLRLGWSGGCAAGWGEDARVGKGPHPMRPHLLALSLDP